MIAAAIRAMSRLQPAPASNCIGTGTGLAPCIAIAPKKFDQVGVGSTTSSPGSAAMRIAVWKACMPPTVTKNRSGPTGSA